MKRLSLHRRQGNIVCAIFWFSEKHYKHHGIWPAELLISEDAFLAVVTLKEVNFSNGNFFYDKQKLVVSASNDAIEVALYKGQQQEFFPDCSFL